MKISLTGLLLLSGLFILGACESADKTAQAGSGDKPTVVEKRVVHTEATVTAINYDTREVILTNAKGESISFIADESVRNFAQVKVGDILNVDYLEGVRIEIVDQNAALGTSTVDAASRAELGDKPGSNAISTTSIVVEIVAIDLENETATIKNAEGQTQVVKPRRPENLKKVEIGDKVMITYTEAIAIKVTEKPKSE